MNNIKNSLLKIKYKPLFNGTKQSNINIINSKIDLSFLLSSQEKKLFITDTNVFNLESVKHFFSQFTFENTIEQNNTKYSVYNYDKHSLIVIPAGEEYKTIESVLTICQVALNANLTRKDTFCAIGGGVITDIGAFAASIYKRGASVEFVPTTLLSMVDAAIGGKTGCDFAEFKNIIGSFFPAKALFMFPEFILSLSNKEFLSGFAESIKTALLFNKSLLNYINDNKEKILNKDLEALNVVISLCAKAKASVVQKDLSEKNIRMLLNFGHTFGHALESKAGLGNLTHGECVAWGIARALKLSVITGLCSSEYYNFVKNLLDSFGYTTKANHPLYIYKDGLLNQMKNDKKNSSTTIRCILQKDIQKNIITEIEDKIILQALEED